MRTAVLQSRLSALLALAGAAFCAGNVLAQTGSEAAAAQAPVSDGRQVFDSACVACHGYDGRGGYGGGVPLDQVRDVALIFSTVTDGRGNMPPLGDLLSQEQIRAVADFIVKDLFRTP